MRDGEKQFDANLLSQNPFCQSLFNLGDLGIAEVGGFISLFRAACVSGARTRVED